MHSPIKTLDDDDATAADDMAMAIMSDFKWKNMSTVGIEPSICCTRMYVVVNNDDNDLMK